MGWLGYTEQETLNTSIPALEGALDAMMEKEGIKAAGMFGAIEPPLPAEPQSPEKVMSIFRSAAGGPAK
jgi:hypothetical protein